MGGLLVIRDIGKPVGRRWAETNSGLYEGDVLDARIQEQADQLRARRSGGPSSNPKSSTVAPSDGSSVHGTT